MMRKACSVLVFCVLAIVFSFGVVSAYTEAPSLKAMVDGGQLPPVNDRISAEPMVIEPWEEIGEYGGAWHRLFLGPSDGSNVARILHDTFLAWSPDGSQVMPHVAKSWEALDDGRTFVFHLRKDMRWSDGQKFTADDIMFWWNDIILNDELTPVKPSWMHINGKLGRVEKIDDYSVKFVFDAPYYLITEWLAGTAIYAPSHYMKQFHPSYTDKETLTAKAKAAAYETWWQLFNFLNTSANNPERPGITAWIFKTPITSNRMVLERNPYSWKVDPQGNQLPYIDRVEFDFVDNIEVLNLRAVAGGVDMQGRHIQINNISVVMSESEKNGYRVLIWPTTGGTEAGLMVNQSYDKDPVVGELLRTRDFRIALSHAIDREELKNLAFYGFGEARQFAPMSFSPYYKPEFPERHLAFDPELANQMLDDLGLAKRDNEGYRTAPNGQRLSLILEATATFGPYVEVAELCADYWQKVGIRTEVNTQERALYWQRLQANDLMIALWDTGGAEHMFVYPYWTMPYNNIARIGPKIGDWYQSGGKTGMAPPTPELARVIELHELAKGATDEERVKLGQEVYDLNTDNLWTIGTVGATPMVQGIVIVKDNFRNVPEGGIENSVVVNTPGNTWPEQYFFKSTK